MKYQLYGDGFHDDAPAIQELLDTGRSEVALPPPLKSYLIGRTLKIHGGQTLRLPAFAAIRLAAGADCSIYAENFTVRDIVFDYTEGSPKLWNMDGIHIEGHCKNGVLCNLKGACHDDLVAITADDGLYGPIENITVDGIFAEHCHSAVRLLSHGIPIQNVRISNVYGSFYTYCIGLTKYHGGPEERGKMKNILIDNIAACACEGTKDVGGGGFPFLWVQSGLDVEELRICNVFREERVFPTPMLKIDAGAAVNGLSLTNLCQKSFLQNPVPQIVAEGEVSELRESGLRNEVK